MMRVSKTSLGNLEELSEGGFGKVYRVPDYRLPNDPAPLAFKEFTSDVAEQAASAQRAVAFRAALDAAGQAGLDQHSVWPRALVEDPGGSVIGLLMPLIPPDFFFRAPDPMASTMSSYPRDLMWLFTDAAYRAKTKADIPDVDLTERLILLGKLVYIVGRLHKLGWVFGDISGKNAVWALEPPRVLLIDCDGAAPLADRGRVQGHTPTWEPPECQVHPVLQSEATDVFKLGLAIIRALVLKQQAKDPAKLLVGRELDAAEVMLLARAVNPNPGIRPTAKELYAYLQQVVAARVQPPQVTFAQLRKHSIIRGHDARVDWQIENANGATLLASGRQYQVDLLQHFDGFAFRPDQSGPVILTVSNRLGSLTYDLGEITLYELPEFSVTIPDMPMPHVPNLPELSLASMAPVLDKVPVVRLPNVPAVPSLQTYDLIDTLMRGTVLNVELPNLAEVVLESSRVVAERIWDDAMERAEAARRGP